MGAPHNILPRINSNYVKMRYNPRVVHGVQFGQVLNGTRGDRVYLSVKHSVAFTKSETSSSSLEYGVRFGSPFYYG